MKVEHVLVGAGVAVLGVATVIAGAAPGDGGSGPRPGSAVAGDPMREEPMLGDLILGESMFDERMPCAPVPRGPMPGGPGFGGPVRGGPVGHRPMPSLLGPVGPALHALDVTAEQRWQIDAIVSDARTALGAARKQLRRSEQAFVDANPPTKFDEAAIRAHVAERAKLEADLLVAEAKARMRVLGVLTAEQRVKLDQLLAAGPDSEWPGEPPPEW